MILLDPAAHPVIGHRGNRAHAPENTLEALQEAVALGVDAVEFDVQVTADGHLVLMHDLTLDRTTDGRGALAPRTLAELRELSASARFRRFHDGADTWRGRTARIPTFDEVVESLPNTLPLIIELKTPAATAALEVAIARHGLQDRVIVAGFEAASTLPMRGGRVALGASTPDVARLLLPALLHRPVARPWFQAFCIPPVYRGIPVPIGGLVRGTRAHGVVTHIWTVNDERQAERLWAKGVNGMISDDPARILALRDRVFGGAATK